MKKRMIEVDISNVWGELALPDLLAMEREVFDAHRKLTEGEGSAAWYCESAEEILRIQKAAEQLRSNSEICVVVGTGGSCLGTNAAIQMLQGVHCGDRSSPQIVFAGDSFSTRRWKEAAELLDGRDFSVIVISGSELPVETGIAFRSLRWMLERKYGTDEANARIYAVTDPEEGALHQMAQEAGWETFATNGCSVLTAAGLLPMAVAGLDISEFLAGAMDGKAEYDLRSYENPVWLYAAVRNLMHRSGKKIEVFASFEFGFRVFGSWWQQRFCRAGNGAFPVTAEYPADLHSLDSRIRQGDRNLFETLVRFAPGEEEHVIGSDWKDLDGLNALAGKTLSFVEEQAHFDTVSAHADAGVPVITMDCGALSARTLGELFYFLELAGGISDCVAGKDSADRSDREP